LGRKPDGVVCLRQVTTGPVLAKGRLRIRVCGWTYLCPIGLVFACISECTRQRHGPRPDDQSPSDTNVVLPERSPQELRALDAHARPHVPALRTKCGHPMMPTHNSAGHAGNTAALASIKGLSDPLRLRYDASRRVSSKPETFSVGICPRFIAR
jgi:hypothetical protein